MSVWMFALVGRCPFFWKSNYFIPKFIENKPFNLRVSCFATELTWDVCKIRPAFVNPDKEKVFVKDDRAGFHEGTIGKRVVAFFERSGVTSPRVGHTHIRKFISTQTHEKGNEEEGYSIEKAMSPVRAV